MLEPRQQAGPALQEPAVPALTYQAAQSASPRPWSAGVQSLSQSAGRCNLPPALQRAAGMASALPSQHRQGQSTRLNRNACG